MSEEYENKISNQIGPGYKTGSKGLFFNDKLTPADVKHYAYIHTCNKGEYSNIGMILLDYSVKDSTKQAKCNLSPAQIKRLYSAAFIREKEFEMTLNKIYGTPQEDGRMMMDKIAIRRATVGTDGKPRKLPWYVEVDNGTALPGRTETGGTYCQAGTYKSNVKLYVNLSDDDFFKVISEVYTYLTAWEISTGLALIAAKDEN